MLSILLVAAATSPADSNPQVLNVSPIIRVVGHGVNRMQPDVAVISFSVRGEGGTPEEATRQLISRRANVDAALAGRADVRTGKLSIMTARDKSCDADDDESVRLSTGSCAAKGYVAVLGFTVKTRDVANAGTLLAELSRNGAYEPSLDSFDLTDRTAANRAAIDDAVRDARAEALAIAAASHVSLGRVRRVEDVRAGTAIGEDIVVTAARPSGGAVWQTLPVAIAPEPIETTATLIVEFEIGGTAP